MPIDYRYHIGSFVAIFLALLLGIVIGIGLAPNPQELNKIASDLRRGFQEARTAREEELKALQDSNREYEMLAKETVAGLVSKRLANRRVAIILDHPFGRSELPDRLRALMQEAGATLTSTTAITREFVALPPEVRQKVSKRLMLYPPPGVHFRSVIAEAFARGLARGRPEVILDLQSLGLLKASADSNYSVRVDAVLLVGGPGTAGDASVERIDLPIIETLMAEGVRVVGCEARDAGVSSMALYKAKGIPTVDNADTQPGRLAVVLALAGANGNFGVKETADRFLPDIRAASP